MQTIKPNVSLGHDSKILYFLTIPVESGTSIK